MLFDEMQALISDININLSMEDIDDLFAVARCGCCTNGNGNNG